MATTIIVLYVFSLALIMVYSILQLHLVSKYQRSFKKRFQKRLPAPAAGELPPVTVQLPVFNERYVVERLIDAVAGFSYPRHLLEIQVLDDSNDETVDISRRKVQDWQKKGLDIKLITRVDRSGFKAGALHEGLQVAKGEFVAIFDADFIPKTDFLLETIPHFLNDENLGMVQTRWEHLNKNYSLLTRVQAFALDAHFSIEQGGRNAGGYYINFNGTAGVWRKTCIHDAGGWQADTLTEDLDLSYRAQIKGWRFKFLEEVGSPAELPVAMTAVKSQQFRWTKGGAETAKKMIRRLWRSNSTLGQKIHGSSHLLSGSIFLLVLLCSLLSVPMLLIKTVNPDYSELFKLIAVFIVSMIFIAVFYFCSFYRKYKNKGAAFLRFIFLFPAFLSLSMGISLHNTIAAVEGLLGFKSPFIRTPKFNISQKDKTWKTNIYLVKKVSLLTIIEAVISLYFFFAVGFAVYFKEYGLLPFHLMLALGFGLVSWYSVRQSVFS